MEWLQANGALVGLAGTVLTAVALGWRILQSVREEIGKVGGNVEKLRLEMRERTERLRLEAREDTGKLRLEAHERTESLRLEAHERTESVRLETRELIENLRQETRERTGKLRLETRELIESLRLESREAHESIGAQIAALQVGQASLREGLAEIRGELRGVTSSIDTLREDFRAHVLGSAAG